MLFQFRSYLNFFFKSTNEHGVHSPFVYDLITKCLYDKKPQDQYKVLQKYRRDLLADKTKIIITDFGAGSKRLDSNQRSISSIAKNAGISSKRAELLYRVVRYFKAKKILEIGTSLGLATSSISLAKPEASIFSLEGCPQTANVAQNQFKKYNLKNVDVIIGEFSKTLPNQLKNNKFDLIYFDGNHQKDPTIDYFEQCLNHIDNNSIFIFDDIYWSKGMKEAWVYIKNHPKVTVSIDTYKWGILFFRKEQPKQHFTIRL